MGRKHRIVVAIAAALAAAASLGAYVHERGERLTQWRRLLEHRAESRTAMLESWIAHEREGLESLVLSPPSPAPLRGRGTDADPGDPAGAASAGRYAGLYLLGSDGRLSAARAGATEPGPEALATARAASAEGRFRAELAVAGGRVVVLLALPGGAGRPRAEGRTVLAIVEGSELLPILRSDGASSHSEETVLLHPRPGEPGQFAITFAGPDGLQALRLPEQSATVRRSIERGALAEEYVDRDGQPVIAASRQMPSTGWFVISKVEASEVLSGARGEVAVEALALALGVLALSLLLRATRREAETRALRLQLETEGRLRDTEAQRNAILDNLPDMAWLKDRDSRFVAVNAALAASVGRQPNEMIGRSDEDLVGAELAAAYRADDRAVMASGVPKRVVEPYETPGAARRMIETIKAPLRDERGRIVGTTGIARDVSERVRMQEEFRRTADTLGALIHASPIAIVGYDLEYRITLWNPAAEALFGWSEGEVIGRPTPLVPPEDAERTRIRRAETVAGRVMDYDAVRLRKDGGCVEIHATVGPLHGPDGSLSGFVALLQDVAQRRRAEALIRQARSLESLSVMAGGVAHDFNNLLAAILGHAAMAQRKLPPGDPAQRNLAHVVECAEKAAETSGKVLAFSGHAFLERESHDLSVVVRSAIGARVAALPASIRLRADLAAVPRAALDPRRVEQAFGHVLDNAVEALGEAGGSIEVATRVLRIGPDDARFSRVTGAQPAPGEYVAIEVRDEGPGIPDEILPRVFEPFFSTKFTGRGMGLAVVLGIVRGHGGGVGVESAARGGTTVTVAFPVETDAAGATAVA